MGGFLLLSNPAGEPLGFPQINLLKNWDMVSTSEGCQVCCLATPADCPMPCDTPSETSQAG